MPKQPYDFPFAIADNPMDHPRFMRWSRIHQEDGDAFIMSISHKGKTKHFKCIWSRISMMHFKVEASGMKTYSSREFVTSNPIYTPLLSPDDVHTTPSSYS